MLTIEAEPWFSIEGTGLRVLGPDALERPLGVDERAVHAEMFRAEPPGLLRLRWPKNSLATSCCINRARFLQSGRK